MSGLQDETNVTCPWCFESQVLYVDPQTAGKFVQDCEVCCRPWSVFIERDPGTGEIYASVDRAQ